MGYEQKTAAAFGMAPEIWNRHANPWSVWTRFATLPLLIVAVWSRVWIGPWAWAVFALLVVWLFVNPRLFPPPASTDRWASKAVFGERVWIARKRTPVPAHHVRMAYTLNAMSMVFTIAMVAGVVALQPVVTVAATLLTYLTKMWFLDRMVWLFDDMAREHEELRAWIR